MGRREGSIAIAQIENDISRLEFSLKRTKRNKIRFYWNTTDRGQGGIAGECPSGERHRGSDQ